MITLILLGPFVPILKKSPLAASIIKKNPLGRKSPMPRAYAPDCLFAIKRATAVPNPHQLNWDYWRLHEVSWLNKQHEPQEAVVTLKIPADSPFLIESKSLKLYCHGLNYTTFENHDALQHCLQQDFSRTLGTALEIKVWSLQDWQQRPRLQPTASLLSSTASSGELDGAETSQDSELHSVLTHSFRSICPVTSQPDWASVWIRYQGNRLTPSGLAAYLMTFREHAGFHENAIDTLFQTLLDKTAPSFLTVWGQFTRRGGIDINPFRSTAEIFLEHYEFNPRA